MTAILANPENTQLSAEEVASRVIEALDDVRSRTHRLAVVGQIWHAEAQERPETVILGPFTARGILDTQDKFLKATEGGSAARQAGQDLAWDPKTRVGRGRFMLAPAFSRPRDAWEFYRRPDPPDPRLLRITESVQRWSAGLWAKEGPPGPVCQCGLPEHPRSTSVGAAVLGPCPKHAA